MCNPSFAVLATLGHQKSDYKVLAGKSQGGKVDNGPTTTTYEELWVLGPPLTDVDRTYNTLYALQYLPEHYKLILPGSHAADKSFLTDISDIVARDALTDRVRFAEKAPSDEPITLAVARLDSPEAIASSILGTAHGRL